MSARACYPVALVNFDLPQHSEPPKAIVHSDSSTGTGQAIRIWVKSYWWIPFFPVLLPALLLVALKNFCIDRSRWWWG